jgi:hypothetical protein
MNGSQFSRQARRSAGPEGEQPVRKLVTNFESPLVLATVSLIELLLLILMMGVTM